MSMSLAPSRACASHLRQASVCSRRPAVPMAAPSSSTRRCVLVRAAANDDDAAERPQTSSTPTPVEATPTDIMQFFQRYDFLSTMMGALVVTGFFWANGQDPMHALSITFSSTIIGVVANEVLFNSSA